VYQKREANTMTSGTSCFIQKMKKNPTYKITFMRIRDYVQHMQYHAIRGKFMGIWPTEKALIGWIDIFWNAKGQIDLELTMIFTSLKYRDVVLENSPYFFKCVGL
jgi:hypothetical protein